MWLGKWPFRMRKGAWIEERMGIGKWEKWIGGNLFIAMSKGILALGSIIGWMFRNIHEKLRMHDFFLIWLSDCIANTCTLLGFWCQNGPDVAALEARQEAVLARLRSLKAQLDQVQGNKVATPSPSVSATPAVGAAAHASPLKVRKVQISRIVGHTFTLFLLTVLMPILWTVYSGHCMKFHKFCRLCWTRIGGFPSFESIDGWRISNAV